MLLRGVHCPVGAYPLRPHHTNSRSLFGRRAFDSDEDVGVSPAGFRARAPLVAERPPANPTSPKSTSQLLLDAMHGRELGGWGSRSGGPLIELSSDSEDEVKVPAPRTQPRSR